MAKQITYSFARGTVVVPVADFVPNGVYGGAFATEQDAIENATKLQSNGTPIHAVDASGNRTVINLSQAQSAVVNDI